MNYIPNYTKFKILSIIKNILYVAIILYFNTSFNLFIIFFKCLIFTLISKFIYYNLTNESIIKVIFYNIYLLILTGILHIFLLYTKYKLPHCVLTTLYFISLFEIIYYIFIKYICFKKEPIKLQEKEFLLYDELSKKTINLSDIISGKTITLYVCGPTVYDECHLGHGRSLIVFDILHRLLIENYKHKQVFFYQNITDIDDKIILKAANINKDPKQVASEYTSKFFIIKNILNVLPATYYPKVTEHLKEIKEFIIELCNNHDAYETNDGVYFDMYKYENSHNTTDVFNQQMENNAKINEHKKYWKDFALWKKNIDDYGYDSPWGKGRPGWHIECSAMLLKYCGKQVDIHGGGCDLAFPHHTNEILQSYTLNKIPPAKIWIHNGMLCIDSIKMSKSLTNSKYLKDIVNNDYSADVFRYWIMMYAHNSMIDFNDITWKEMNKAMINIRKFYFANLDKMSFIHINLPYNLPNIIQLLHQYINSNGYNEVYSILKICGFYIKKNSSLSIQTIEELVSKRIQYKKNKNFKEADNIRLYLFENNIEIRDNTNGTEWNYI